MFAGMKNRVRELRKARGWTIEHLADLVGTSKGHLSDIETGKREASVPMLRSIAQALGATDVEIFAPATESEQALLDLVRDFSRLSPEDQQAVARHARGLLPPDDT